MAKFGSNPHHCLQHRHERGEIRQLRRSYIDKDVGFVRLPEEVTTEDKPKAIPINRHVREVLDKRPRSLLHDYVFFKDDGEPITDPGWLDKPFETACKRAGHRFNIWDYFPRYQGDRKNQHAGSEGR